MLDLVLCCVLVVLVGSDHFGSSWVGSVVQAGSDFFNSTWFCLDLVPLVQFSVGISSCTVNITMKY